MKQEVLNQIANGLIVSCQALKHEPLHSSFIMSRMARAAVESGAVGIRANSVVDIQAILDTVNVPVIGIIKSVYGDSPVFITPTIKEVRAVCESGAQIVAMDATTRNRPNNERLEEIINTVKREYPDIVLMADTSTISEAVHAGLIGFDLVGTTLYGYTQETEGANIADNDFHFLKEVISQSSRPVVAEGKIDTPVKARSVLELGCISVVCGSIITRPQEITKLFVNEIGKMELLSKRTE